MNHARNHGVAGDNDVVAFSPAGGKFRNHRFVVVVNVQGHFAVKLLFKSRHDLGIEVFRPGENIELLLGFATADEHCRPEDEQEHFHLDSPCWPRRCSHVTVTVPTIDASTIKVERALMSGVMPRLTDE